MKEIEGADNAANSWLSLTRREKEFALAFLKNDGDTIQIAQECVISTKTVATHLQSIYNKFYLDKNPELGHRTYGIRLVKALSRILAV